MGHVFALAVARAGAWLVGCASAGRQVGGAYRTLLSLSIFLYRPLSLLGGRKTRGTGLYAELADEYKYFLALAEAGPRSLQRDSSLGGALGADVITLGQVQQAGWWLPITAWRAGGLEPYNTPRQPVDPIADHGRGAQAYCRHTTIKLRCGVGVMLLLEPRRAMCCVEQRAGRGELELGATGELAA